MEKPEAVITRLAERFMVDFNRDRELDNVCESHTGK